VNKGLKNADLVEAFKRELLKRDICWFKLPLDESSTWRLRMRAWNPSHSHLMFVEAYDIDLDPDCPNEDTTHAIIAFYEDENKFLTDAGFGLSAYRVALELIDDIVSEQFVIETNEGADTTWSARMGPRTKQLEDSPSSRCYSWLRTFDQRAK
jgi:hypothetical protein